MGFFNKTMSLVQVQFIDKSAKTFSLEKSGTAAQLRDMVVSRINLKEDGCFALFEQKGGWERCIEPDEKPVEIQAQWEKEKSDRKKSDPDPIFLFKKKIFLKDDDREMEDSKAKDLIYKQALYCVISSEYPCQLSEAIKLAGLQFQVLYGDHNKAVHVPGFLSRNIGDFIPKTFIGSRKTGELEQQILDEHEKLIGKSDEDAKTEYLNIVKSWTQFYGTTFFPPCKCFTGGRSSHKVIIGVNYEGIRLFKPKTKQSISEHDFTEIVSWASSPDTFSFEYGNQNHAEKFTFETRQGIIIASTIQSYIDILVQLLRGNDEEDDEDLS